MKTAKEKKNEAVGIRRMAAALEKVAPEFRVAAYAQLEKQRKSKEKERTRTKMADLKKAAADVRAKLLSVQSETDKEKLKRELTSTNRKLRQNKAPKISHNFLILPGSFGSGKRK